MENQRKFVKVALETANKTEKDLLIESAIEFVENATIDIQSEITNIETSVLPKLKLELKRAENVLSKREKEFEVIRFSIPANKTAQGLLDARYSKQVEIRRAKDNIQEIESRISEAEAQLNELKSVLEDLLA